MYIHQKAIDILAYLQKTHVVCLFQTRVTSLKRALCVQNRALLHGQSACTDTYNMHQCETIHMPSAKSHCCDYAPRANRHERQIPKRSTHTLNVCNTLQHTAPHCTTLQHTATHCNTLQHTATHIERHTT